MARVLGVTPVPGPPSAESSALLPVGEWPGVALSFTVEAGPSLVVTVAPSSGAVPGPEEYGRAWHDLADGVVATLATSLAAEPFTLDADVLTRFAAASYLAAAAVATVEPLVVTATVDGLRDGYGATPDALAAANAATLATALFGEGTSLTLGESTDVAVPPGETLADFSDSLGCTPGALLAANPSVTLHDAVVPGHVTLADGVEGCAPAPATLGEAGVAFAEANALVAGLVAPGVAVTTAVTTGAHDTLGWLAERAGTTVAGLVAIAADVPLLVPGTRSVLPPAPVRFGVTLPAALPEEAEFPLRLTATLRLTRGSESTESVVACAVTHDPATRAAFAAAYPLLRLARCGNDTWAVSFATGGVSEVTVAPEARAFALQPLTTTGSADADLWARLLLGDVDRFLTTHAPALYVEARDAVENVLRAKRVLARAIARGLGPVAGTDHSKTAHDAAVAVLADELADSLAGGYDVTALVQYDVAVTPPSHPAGGRPSRLAGVAVPRDGATFTASAARVELSDATTYVTVALRASHPERAASLPVRLRYDVTGLELGERDGATAPRRLVFEAPLTGDAKPAALRTDLAPIDVPVVLRSLPDPPALLAHEAVSETVPETGGTSLKDAARWTYRVTCAHDAAAQDELGVTARFGAVPRPLVTASQADDLVAALRAYVTVEQAVWAALGDAATRANAASSFATLVTAVATAWDARVSDGAAVAAETPPATAEHGVRVRLTQTEDAEGTAWFDTAIVTATTAEPGPGGAWPDLTYEAHGEQVALVPGAIAGTARTYAFPPGVHAERRPILAVAWPRLPLAAYRTARAVLATRRNASLADPAYVYAPPDVTSADAVTPSIVVSDEVDVTSEGTLAAALATVFADVAGTSGMAAVVTTTYEYEVAPGMPASMPVSLVRIALDGAAAAAVATATETWYATFGGGTGPAWFVFAVTVLSESHPVLVVRRVVYQARVQTAPEA